MSRYRTTEYVQKYFKDRGCELLEEYVDSKTLMRYRCKCGNIAKIRFNDFQQGHRCIECGSGKHTNEYIQQYFKDRGCRALDKYVNSKTKMRYICECGNEAMITFNSFRRGTRCAKCGGKEKHTIEYAKEFFKDGGCTLLESKYIDALTLMRYMCECGNEAMITFNSFQQGHRCMKCAAENRSGENHPRYNSDLTEEERQIKRKYPEYIEWVQAVFERDNYTCQKCSQYGGSLNAHHIEAYATNKELRVDVNNGITFCKTCHKDFHHQYGNDCNYSQLLEFLETR